MLIATEAIGVDAVIRSGAIAGYGFKEGHILGSEVAGTVTAAGDGVDASWAGRCVWAFTGLGGGHVEQAIAPAGEILPLPANLSAAGAVTLGSSGDGTWAEHGEALMRRRKARYYRRDPRPSVSVIGDRLLELASGDRR